MAESEKKWASPQEVNEWKESRPKSGISSGAQWKEWAKTSPNRGTRASEGFKPKEGEGSQEVKTSVKSLSMGTKAEKAEKKDVRDEEVEAWKKKQPVWGKGESKTSEEKEAKRKKMIDWASRNPNRGSNAGRALGQQKNKKGKDGAK
jgi:hypothetical protein